MIQGVIRRAQAAHRSILEATYEDVCTIYEIQSIKDPVTKVTVQEEMAVVENQPCHLSFSGSPAAADSDTVTGIEQEIKLFLMPEIEVKPGSRIEVERQGRTDFYAQSGKAAVYGSHQEILLKLWEGYA